MTSRRSCYVYLQLPGSLEIVTCGRFEHAVLPDGRRVGRFVYGRSYRARADAVPLDPYGLPVTPRRFETARLGGTFGVSRSNAGLSVAAPGGTISSALPAASASARRLPARSSTGSRE